KNDLDRSKVGNGSTSLSTLPRYTKSSKFPPGLLAAVTSVIVTMCPSTDRYLASPILPEWYCFRENHPWYNLFIALSSWLKQFVVYNYVFHWRNKNLFMFNLFSPHVLRTTTAINGIKRSIFIISCEQAIHSVITMFSFCFFVYGQNFVYTMFEYCFIAFGKKHNQFEPCHHRPPTSIYSLTLSSTSTNSTLGICFHRAFFALRHSRLARFRVQQYAT